MTNNNKAAELRKNLVDSALAWERYFGVGPSITSALSELDAAFLVGIEESAYCLGGQVRTAVTKDVDFVHLHEGRQIRYQVTANRPSGKPGSFVTLVSRKNEDSRPFGWDRLIWILYDKDYVLQEAWEFTAEDYRARFGNLKRLSPAHMRQGRRLSPK